ncbi:hypothetical protein K466DRAFT_569238 [Polyporus arcularius HHB13444]|uniref:Uncharacterized protein n=1 Tax=Polyporus arcularius HHB13444 TaxID=1314778 RepID=A0A5C3NVP3_9APHY|nr:hypothetical protein K466DRAFT_569238 [Polyporus arcularius HHB13444]
MTDGPAPRNEMHGTYGRGLTYARNVNLAGEIASPDTLCTETYAPGDEQYKSHKLDNDATPRPHVRPLPRPDEDEVPTPKPSPRPLPPADGEEVTTPTLTSKPLPVTDDTAPEQEAAAVTASPQNGAAGLLSCPCTPSLGPATHGTVSAHDELSLPPPAMPLGTGVIPVMQSHKMMKIDGAVTYVDIRTASPAVYPPFVAQADGMDTPQNATRLFNGDTVARGQARGVAWAQFRAHNVYLSASKPS